MILFFDTETTGFVRKNIPHNDPKQARVCQLAALLCEPSGDVIAEMNVIIRPDGWEIPSQVAAIHGIDTDRANRVGIPIAQALSVFGALHDLAILYVAHNFDFDNQMMEIESFCLPSFKWRPTQSYCTMKTSTPICQIPSARGGFKWPKLQEIHKHLFGVEFEDAHDAMADVRATKRVFFELKARGY